MHFHSKIGVFTAVMLQVEFFWIAIPCSVVVGYQCFGGTCCLHLQGEVNGTGKIGIGIEYKRGQSLAANRKWEGVVWQPVGSRKRQGY